MTQPNQRIAMFDSGLGGLTVLRALRKVLPYSDVVYAADTARVPYGDRPLDQVQIFAQQMIAWLRGSDPALLIIACGTTCSAFDASGYEVPDIQTLPIVDYGVRAAAAVPNVERIGVVATSSTIRSGVFEAKLSRAVPGASITSIAAPRLVPLVESCKWSTADARDAVAECCAPFLEQRCDTVILGCTHFPLLREWFVAALGPNVRIIDPSDACAAEAASLLQGAPLGAASLEFAVSGDVQQFARAAYNLTGLSPTALHHIDFARDAVTLSERAETPRR